MDLSLRVALAVAVLLVGWSFRWNGKTFSQMWSANISAGSVAPNLAPQCTHPDYAALVALYNSTDGPNWTDNSGWADGAAGIDCDPCGWYGVSCDENDRVICIDLDGIPDCSNDAEGGNNLIGILPTEFDALPFLEGLFLSENGLSGTIPDFANLPNLTHFYCRSNGLDGSIPDFSNLPNLSYFGCENNQLIGNIPDFLNLPNLGFFSCANNQLTGNIPDFSNLSKLSYFGCEFNQLVGSIPDFSNLPNLEVISCNNNQLSGEIPDFSSLPALRVIFCGSNQLSGGIPDFTDISNLELLFLDNNQLSGSIPDFDNLTNLENLSCYNNQLSGIIPNFINLPNLKFFLCFNNQLSGSIPDFTNLTNLELFSCFENQLSGSIPDFSNSPNLQYFDAKSNQLSGCFPDWICTTESVFLDNNPALPWNGDKNNFCNGIPQIGAPCDDGNPQTTGEEILADCSCGVAPTCTDGQQNGDETGVDCGGPDCPPCPCEHPDYAALMDFYNATDGPNWNQNAGWVDGAAGTDCDPCSWTGIVCNENGRVTSIFFLLPNQMSGTIPSSIGDLTALQTLWIVANKLSGEIPASLGNLTALESLNFNGNNLSGTIPASLGNISTLRFLSLLGTQLSGTIPASLGNLTALEILRIHSNDLSGIIPISLGNLTALRHLSLGGNLSGTIPSSLGNLTALESLYLNNNQLSGTLPESLGNLTQLTQLYLNDNQLAGCFPESYLDLCGSVPEISFAENPALPWGGNFDNFCAGEPQPGAACDDGNPTTIDDQILADCSCGLPCTISVALATTPDYCGQANGTVRITAENTESLSYSWSFGGANGPNADQLAAGAYTVTISDGTCETVETFTIAATEAPAQSQFGAELCTGQSLTINGTIYDAANPSGTETLLGAAANGCDSVVVVDLAFSAALETTLTDRLCFGESRQINGKIYDRNNPSGRDTLTSAGGCDSILNVQFTFAPEPQTASQVATLCLGDVVTVGDQDFGAAGSYAVVLKDERGCDSVYLDLLVEVLPRDSSRTSQTLCAGERIDFFGQELDQPGTYRYVSPTSAGCDSVYILELSVVDLMDAQATDDAYTLGRTDPATELRVLANDELPTEGALEILEVPALGTASLQNNRLFFTPNGTSFGRDSLVYGFRPATCPDALFTATVYLEIEVRCGEEIAVTAPRAFTPNGDGINDAYEPVLTLDPACAERLEGLRITIVNTWGEIVFRPAAYQVWDGTNANGSLAPPGNYFAILQLAGEKPIKLPLLLTR